MSINKVDFALLLFDEFDGAPINDASVRFTSGGRAITPIKKADGFYVFCGMGGGEIQLEINRPRYQIMDIKVNTSTLEQGNPVVRVRLFRQFSHWYTDCAWLHFKAVPDCDIYIFAPEEGLRLAAVTPNERKISLLGYGAQGMGKRFSLEKNGQESFILQQMLTNGVYQIDKILGGQSKSGQSLLRAYRSRGRADGGCYIPVEQQHKDQTSAIYWSKENKKWVLVSATVQV